MGTKNFNFNYTGHNMCWHRISRSYLQLLQPAVYTGGRGWLGTRLCFTVPCCARAVPICRLTRKKLSSCRRTLIWRWLWNILVHSMFMWCHSQVAPWVQCSLTVCEEEGKLKLYKNGSKWLYKVRAILGDFLMLVPSAHFRVLQQWRWFHVMSYVMLRGEMLEKMVSPGLDSRCRARWSTGMTGLPASESSSQKIMSLAMLLPPPQRWRYNGWDPNR